MGYWKLTYKFYGLEQANRASKNLKHDGVKVKMSKRKLAAWEQKRHNAKYVYSIYRWKI